MRHCIRALGPVTDVRRTIRSGTCSRPKSGRWMVGSGRVGRVRGKGRGKGKGNELHRCRQLWLVNFDTDEELAYLSVSRSSGRSLARQFAASRTSPTTCEHLFEELQGVCHGNESGTRSDVPANPMTRWKHILCQYGCQKQDRFATASQVLTSSRTQSVLLRYHQQRSRSVQLHPGNPG